MLTDAKLRHIQRTPPAKGQKKHSDEKALYLLATAAGGLYWQMKYRYGGKEKTLSFGTYPDVSLSEARRLRDQARALLAQGIDPNAKKQTDAARSQREQTIFAMIADQWLAFRDSEGKHNEENTRRMKADVYPAIGNLPIGEITEEILEARVFAPILARDARELAKRVRSDLRGVFTMARKKKLISHDPLQDITLPTPKKSNFAALTEPADVKRLAIALWRPDQRIAPSVVNAAQLGMLVFLRPGDLRFLQWSEVDLIGDEWGPVIQITTRKRQKDLIVPLSRQAVAVLVRQREHSCNSAFVFPAQQANTKDPCLSEGTIRNYLSAHGFAGEQTHHGMRATAKTLLVERLGADDRYVEMQLTHTVKDHLGTAYNRAKWLDDRRAMMQEWADYLDTLRDPQVIPFARPASA